MVIVGSEVFEREDAAGVHAAVAAISQKAKLNVAGGEDDEWKVLNVLHKVLLYIFDSLFKGPGEEIHFCDFSTNYTISSYMCYFNWHIVMLLD